MEKEKYTLNIGLIDNPMERNEIEKEVYVKLGGGLFNMKSRIENGSYNNKVEPTVVLTSNTPYSLSYIVKSIEELCDIFGQECIAIKSKYFELLVYSTTYKLSKMKFNNEFFIEY